MTNFLKYEDLDGIGWINHSSDNKEEKRAALRQRLQEDVKALTNDQLLCDYSIMQGGDDYDGCFTVGGRIAEEVLDAELTARLVACGFLEG